MDEQHQDSSRLIVPGEDDPAMIRRAVERVYAYAGARRFELTADMSFAIGIVCGAAMRAAEAIARSASGTQQ